MAEYTFDVQKLYLEMLLADAESFARAQNIFTPKSFDRKLQPIAKFIKDYVDEYKVMPEVDQVNAKFDIKLKTAKDLDPSHFNWLLDEFETFSRHKALEGAILQSADLLEKGDYGPVEDMVKDAVAVGLTRDLGTDYFEDPKGRLEFLKSSHGQVSTGMTTNIPTRQEMKQMNDVEVKVKMLKKKSGNLQLKYLPSASTIMDVRAYIKELELKNKKKVDAILIDYLDLMMPKSKRVSPSDLFVKDKYVSEELRNFAVDKQCLLTTASQLNRASVEEIEFDHSHIAGGLSKVQTADNVIGIFTSRAMRERGRYQVQFMKTRSSSGVGHKIDLEFDVDTLRIRNLEEEEAKSHFEYKTSAVYETLKQKSKITADVPDPTKGDKVGKIKAEVEGTKLRKLLNELHSDEEQ